MARHIVIGTAGHVDHGKTTLVKALTGIETDTMKEEKKRGLTINLGFAYLDLPNGQRVGIVDVPGHEKFIKNMVAGLPGINMVLLVIDANEGVMPQTIEHLDILTLLGVKEFLIVLTKIDTVDEELRELVREDIREQLAGTAAADADIVETDAMTGRGIPELIQKIQDMTAEVPETGDDGDGRMNIDRVFSVKGFGTVVTGTLLDGSVSVGDDLYVYPGCRKVRVRNIQNHEQNVTKAEPRQRTALNLANIAKEDLTRGDVLSASDALEMTWMLDVKVKCIDHSPVSIDLWDRVRLLIGTREVMARVVPIGTECIEPGEEGFLQLRMEQDQVVVKERDHFILRTFSPMHTIAGGEVLDANPKKHRRFKSDVLERLKARDEGNTDEIIADFLHHKSSPFTKKDEIIAYTHLEGSDIDIALEQLLADGVLRETPLGYIHEEAYKTWRAKALQLLLDYHRQYPLRSGMPGSEFRSRLSKKLPEKEMQALMDMMISDQCCRTEGQVVAASRFQVVFTAAQKKARQSLEKALDISGYTPLKIDELLAMDKQAGAVLDAMKDATVLFLTPEYVISKSWYDKAVTALVGYFRNHEAIELSDFRDLLQSNRKASLLLLDYMDVQHVTKRLDNHRVPGEAIKGTLS